jgi:hypothetical protein
MMKKTPVNFLGLLILGLVALAVTQVATRAIPADLIVSANDAKYARVEGRDTYPSNAGPDTLTVIDASSNPPRVTATIPVQHSLAGPPQAVAITPNGRLAVVSAPNHYDRVEQKTRGTEDGVRELPAGNRPHGHGAACGREDRRRRASPGPGRQP